MDFKVRDLRKKQQFIIDDEYLNGYARLCGIHATGVYMALCRHANMEQSCFPSKKLLSEELDIPERSVYTALKKLEEWQIVKSVSQGRKQDGSYQNNTYFLLDKIEWKPKPNNPQANRADGTERHSPQANDDTHRRQDVPNKDAHTKDAHKGKIEKIDNRNPEIQAFWDYGLALGFTETKQHLQRFALKRLLSKHNELQLRTAAKFAASIKSDRYAPQVNSWLDLEDKYLKLRDYVARQQQPQRKITTL